MSNVSLGSSSSSFQRCTTILLLSADPDGMAGQRLEQERRDLEAGLERAHLRDQFRLISRVAARPRDMQRAMLEYQPQMVHFSGRGSGEMGLAFENEVGDIHPIDAVALANLFELFADSLYCVILNACDSDLHAQAIAQHIPYVIGMSSSLSDRGAIEFTVAFYDALGAGKEIEFAYKFACRALGLAGLREEAQIPVLRKKVEGQALAEREASLPASAEVKVASETQPAFAPTPIVPPPLSSICQDASWVDRPEMNTLLPIVQGECRIVALVGITGIGKTALAERLAQSIEDGKLYRRLNLEVGGIAADFIASGSVLLRSLGEEPTLEDQKEAKNLLAHLLQILRAQPYRVQIDSMERLLTGDEQEGWSEFVDPDWNELWRQFLAGGECASQVILTTQDLPAQLEAIGSRHENFWHCQVLYGLSEAEQLQLFQKRGIVITSENEPYLQRIGQLYEGHPLVLRVIAEDIKETRGDVKRYWQQGRFESMQANHPGQFSRRRLQIEVKQRVKESIALLPEDARELLCRSAVYCRPVPESFWLAMLDDGTESQQQAALNLLKSRNLAEEDWQPHAWLGADESIPIRQHNLIRSVAYEMLKDDRSTWEISERKAAELWLTQYEPAIDIPNLEKLRGYLEAFHHSCELEDWTKAGEIYVSPIVSLGQILHWQLFIWGNYQELIQISSQLLHRAASQIRMRCLLNLGNSYSCLGNQGKAIDYYQQSLEFAREVGDRQGEGGALGNLGVAYYNLGNYEQAIDFHRQALLIACEIGDRRGEGNALGNLGNAYNRLGHYEQAIESCQQQFSIAREIGARRDEGNALGSLGMAYDGLGNYEQAIKLHQQHLAIAYEVGDRRGQGYALGNLAQAFVELKQYPGALKNLQLILEIFREIGARADEAETYKNLAKLYQKLGELERAREECDRALQLALELRIPLVKECEALKRQLDEGEDGLMEGSSDD